METARIRAHHLQRAVDYLNGAVSEESILSTLYGAGFMSKAMNTYERMARGDLQVIVIDDFDTLCSACNFKRTNGCDTYRGFVPSMETSREDRNFAVSHGVVIGRQYNGAELLRKLGLRKERPVKGTKPEASQAA